MPHTPWPCLVGSLLLAGQPNAMIRPRPQAPRNQILIAKAAMPLTHPEALAAFACVQKALPTWRVSPASRAGKQEVPRSAITLRCQVSFGDSQGDWEFLLEPAATGQLRLRAARALD